MAKKKRRQQANSEVPETAVMTVVTQPFEFYTTAELSELSALDLWTEVKDLLDAKANNAPLHMTDIGDAFSYLQRIIETELLNKDTVDEDEETAINQIIRELYTPFNRHNSYLVKMNLYPTHPQYMSVINVLEEVKKIVGEDVLETYKIGEYGSIEWIGKEGLLSLKDELADRSPSTSPENEQYLKSIEASIISALDNINSFADGEYVPPIDPMRIETLYGDHFDVPNKKYIEEELMDALSRIETYEIQSHLYRTDTLFAEFKAEVMKQAEEAGIIEPKVNVENNVRSSDTGNTQTDQGTSLSSDEHSLEDTQSHGDEVTIPQEDAEKVSDRDLEHTSSGKTEQDSSQVSEDVVSEQRTEDSSVETRGETNVEENQVSGNLVSDPVEEHSDVGDLERSITLDNTRATSDDAVQNDGLVTSSGVREEIPSTGGSQVEPQPVTEDSVSNLSEIESHSSAVITDPVSVNAETTSGSVVDGEVGIETSSSTSESTINQPANTDSDTATTGGEIEEVPPTSDPANDTLTVPSVESEEPSAVEVLNPSDTEGNKDPNEFAVEDNFSPFVKSTLAQLKDYTETMAIGQMVSRETINLQQRRLNRLLTQVIMAVQHKDFEDLMYETVNIFIEHRDRCFHPSYVYRGIDEISALEMDTKERMRFYGMIDAFRGLADPQQHGRLAHNYLFSEIRETVPEQYAARFILFCKRYAE